MTSLVRRVRAWLERVRQAVDHGCPECGCTERPAKALGTDLCPGCGSYWPQVRQ